MSKATTPSAGRHMATCPTCGSTIATTCPCGCGDKPVRGHVYASAACKRRDQKRWLELANVMVTSTAAAERDAIATRLANVAEDPRTGERTF